MDRAIARVGMSCAVVIILILSATGVGLFCIASAQGNWASRPLSLPGEATAFALAQHPLTGRGALCVALPETIYAFTQQAEWLWQGESTGRVASPSDVTVDSLGFIHIVGSDPFLNIATVSNESPSSPWPSSTVDNGRGPSIAVDPSTRLERVAFWADSLPWLRVRDNAGWNRVLVDNYRSVPNGPTHLRISSAGDIFVAYSGREPGAIDFYFAVATFNWGLNRFFSTYLALAQSILATSLRVSTLTRTPIACYAGGSGMTNYLVFRYLDGAFWSGGFVDSSSTGAFASSDVCETAGGMQYVAYAGIESDPTSGLPVYFVRLASRTRPEVGTRAWSIETVFTSTSINQIANNVQLLVEPDGEVAVLSLCLDANTNQTKLWESRLAASNTQVELPPRLAAPMVWPNPIAAGEALHLSLAEVDLANLEILDLMGRRQAIVLGHDGRGAAWVRFIRKPAPGLYWVRIRGEATSLARRLVIVG